MVPTRTTHRLYIKENAVIRGFISFNRARTYENLRAEGDIRRRKEQTGRWRESRFHNQRCRGQIQQRLTDARWEYESHPGDGHGKLLPWVFQQLTSALGLLFYKQQRHKNKWDRSVFKPWLTFQESVTGKLPLSRRYVFYHLRLRFS